MSSSAIHASFEDLCSGSIAIINFKFVQCRNEFIRQNMTFIKLKGSLKEELKTSFFVMAYDEFYLEHVSDTYESWC